MLTQCPDCGQSVSTEAPAYPHCGKPNLNAQGPNAEIEKAQAAVQVAKGEVMIAGIGCLTFVFAWLLLCFLGPIGFLIDFIAFPSMRRWLSYFLLVVGLGGFLLASLTTGTTREAGAIIGLSFSVAAFISFTVTRYLAARNPRKASR
jgi:hypothetical protein